MVLAANRECCGQSAATRSIRTSPQASCGHGQSPSSGCPTQERPTCMSVQFKVIAIAGFLPVLTSSLPAGKVTYVTEPKEAHVCSALDRRNARCLLLLLR